MSRQDLQCEWAFYGAKLDVIGMLYFRGAELPAKYPDVLFFLLYTCRLLTDRKMTITGVNTIQKDLEQTPEDWERILNWEEERPYTCPCRTITYRGYSRSALSASILFHKRLHFRSGRMGFGFFSNGKHFSTCAVASVFSLLESIYNANSKEPPEEEETDRRRRMNESQRENLNLLWQAASAVHRLRVGVDIARGNCDAVAVELYRRLTGDDYPSAAQFPPVDSPGLDRAVAWAASKPESRAAERLRRRAEQERALRAEMGADWAEDAAGSETAGGREE